METQALAKAIQNKKKDVKLLKRAAERCEEVLEPLSKKHKKKWKKHFNKKFTFYKEKEVTDWKLWPKKWVSKDRKKKNTVAKSQRNLKWKAKKVENTAKALINNGSVRVLVETNVPAAAIAVLGKGLGFVPTPKPNAGELRLDARRLVNKLLYKKEKSEQCSDNEKSSDEEIFKMPTKLRHTNYFLASQTNTDPEINMAVNHINTNVNSTYFDKSSVPVRNNLSHAEAIGLKWLQEKVNNNEIDICQADKGGAILILPANYRKSKIAEKVNDCNKYQVLEKDERPDLYDTLITKWKYGLRENFVSNTEAKAIVGITAAGNKSTASRFKFGRTYFVPSPKIHKLSPEELRPGCNIPVRLITCLQEGITKRSDVYIASKWLKDLEKDFCGDLVKDTNESLRWLEKINTLDKSKKRKLSPFTFDFEALYDSLDPDLVFEALREAMDVCRPSWRKKFKDWILDLVKLSIRASIGEFDGKFYKQLGGLPTGGSLIVEIANITVYYVLKHSLYNNKHLMKDVIGIKRFIDDGVGVHRMNQRTFSKWKKTVSSLVSEFGLTIKDSDWNQPDDNQISVNFLDIRFWFDSDFSLQTDLYRKPTDSRVFLHYSSCHPNFTFSGIVYSQGLRLRRLINNDKRLAEQLDYLKADFLKCMYPVKLLDDIFSKIKDMSRNLE